MKENNPQLRTVNVVRYITPLREGGSLPAIVEADDGFKYLLKFYGAGQGTKALIAEIVFAHLDSSFGQIEGDEEVQDLLKASVGLNLGLHYLSGAITFDPLVTTLDSQLASQIVWLDCLLTNVDRTARNTNMLMWHKELWLIDHGASLYFHHSWQDWEKKAKMAFTLIKNHVLLSQASKLDAVDAKFRSLLTEESIYSIVKLIPDIWLKDEEVFNSTEQHRNAYAQFLITRLLHSEIFVKEAQYARASLV